MPPPAAYIVSVVGLPGLIGGSLICMVVCVGDVGDCTTKTCEIEFACLSAFTEEEEEMMLLGWLAGFGGQ